MRATDRLRDERTAETDAAERSFFEVTDRQLNLEYVPPERREPLRKFCATLTMARNSGAHPTVSD